MKVKIGELKAHLSKYVRQLREEGGAIEVCLREDPVAYLSAVAPGANQGVMDETITSLQRSGIQVQAARKTLESVNLPEPLVTGKPASNEAIVDLMRRERDW